MKTAEIFGFGKWTRAGILAGATVLSGLAALAQDEPEGVEKKPAVEEGSPVRSPADGEKTRYEDPLISAAGAASGVVDMRPGWVNTDGEGKAKLTDLVTGQVVFEAGFIDDMQRTFAGLWVFTARMGDEAPGEDGTQIVEKDGKRVWENPQGIWIITPGGEKVRLTPENIDAWNPLVRPDGAKIAFTGQEIDGTPPKLYIVDVATKKLTVAWEKKVQVSDYVAGPVAWSRDGKEMRISESSGEAIGRRSERWIELPAGE